MIRLYSLTLILGLNANAQIARTSLNGTITDDAGCS